MESREIYIIGDELSSIGFKLAGVRTYAIDDVNRDEVYDKIKDKKAVLILTHRAMRILGDKAEKLKANSLLISVPEKHDDEYLSLRHLIRSTIGFDFK
ncbi:MAG: V-type ATP synthase subunit F [Candidatus Altiarchaeota archaeon]